MGLLGELFLFYAVKLGLQSKVGISTNEVFISFKNVSDTLLAGRVCYNVW